MGIGDCLMASGHARVLQKTDPRKVKVMHQHKPAWSEIWENNPRMAKKDDQGDFQVLYARSVENNMRPYHLSKSERQWKYNLEYRPEVGEIYLTQKEKSFCSKFFPQVVVEPNIKPGASPNKQWGWERWERFAALAQAQGIRLYQVGPRGTRALKGVELIATENFRLGCAVLANAKAFVGGEGGLHHAAAALGIPGVVVFGGFTPVELTGYAIHRNLGVSLGDACGMRVPCPHCHHEMEKIEPEMVLQQLNEVMKRDA